MPGAWRERNIREESGQEAADRSGNAGRHEHARVIHTCLRQIRRVDEDDIRHRKEGRQTSDDLRLDCGAMFFELKETFQGNPSI